MCTHYKIEIAKGKQQELIWDNKFLCVPFCVESFIFQVLQILAFECLMHILCYCKKKIVYQDL